MPVELTWNSDRLELYNELIRRNYSDTHAVRHMLWFILSGRIAEGHVFVDEWPFFRHIACMHPSHLYRPNSDMDFVTLGVAGENDFDVPKFRTFFQNLIDIRRWRQRPGAVLGYVNLQLADVACDSLLPQPQGGHISTVGPFRQYTAAERENMEEYEQKRKQAIAKLKETGLTMDRLQQDETHLVADKSAYVVPYQADMLRWLSKVLPSACIRDKENQPVSWIASYSSGAFGASYVMPEFRGQGLADAMTLEMVCSMAKITSSNRFFWISDSNKASIKQVQRMYKDLKSSETLAKCVVFTPAVTMEKKPAIFVPGSGWSKEQRPQASFKKFGNLGQAGLLAAKGLRYLPK